MYSARDGQIQTHHFVVEEIKSQKDDSGMSRT